MRKPGWSSQFEVDSYDDDDDDDEEEESRGRAIRTFSHVDPIPWRRRQSGVRSTFAAGGRMASDKSKVRWLSCEALIESLRFQHLDRFNWIVIGGASKTSRTPKWAPPFTWIDDLVQAAARRSREGLFQEQPVRRQRAHSRNAVLPADRARSGRGPGDSSYLVAAMDHVAVIAGIDRRSSSVGTEYVRHLRLGVRRAGATEREIARRYPAFLSFRGAAPARR